MAHWLSQRQVGGIGIVLQKHFGEMLQWWKLYQVEFVLGVLSLILVFNFYAFTGIPEINEIEWYRSEEKSFVMTLKYYCEI